ncbi:MAG: ADP-ribose pyrophosphatase [Candidatus Saccharibacteria bacterium]|nr:ADP-ribose pyrophosphatase [Candidatus Saccharibacteria bacterium]
MKLSWQRLDDKTESVLVGWRTIVQKHFRMPDGSEKVYETFNREDMHCAAVIALTVDNMIVVARQYRPGPEMVMDEIPGGGSEDDDDSQQAAAIRELREETGYGVGSIEKLGIVYKDAYSNAAHHYFLARDCRLLGDQQLDATEFIEVKLISIDQFLENAKTGRMSDSAAVALVYEQLIAIRDA